MLLRIEDKAAVAPGDGGGVPAPITVRDATYAFLRSVGISKIFGNPGSTELAMFRDFPEDFGRAGPRGNTGIARRRI